MYCRSGDQNYVVGVGSVSSEDVGSVRVSSEDVKGSVSSPDVTSLPVVTLELQGAKSEEQEERDDAMMQMNKEFKVHGVGTCCESLPAV